MQDLSGGSRSRYASLSPVLLDRPYVNGGLNLCALDPDGNLKWQFPLDQGLQSMAVGSDRTVCVGGLDDLPPMIVPT